MYMLKRSSTYLNMNIYNKNFIIKLKNNIIKNISQNNKILTKNTIHFIKKQ